MKIFAQFGLFLSRNPKILSQCLYKRQMADGVGANPERFTQQRNRPKGKAAPRMHPDTVKKAEQTKKNRELPYFEPKFPTFVPSFYHRIAYSVLDPPRPVRRVRFYYGRNARILAANSGRNRFIYEYWYNSP